MKTAMFPDDYFRNLKIWREELAALRKVLLSTSLGEEIKWGDPLLRL